MTRATYSNHTSRLYAFLRSVPGRLAGVVPDPDGIARRVSERVSQALLEMVRESFWQKSRGFRGEDGVLWAEHAPSTKKRRGNFALVGLATGEMFRSLSAEPEAGRVAVGAAAPHAKFFHRKRPLWPQRLPRVWMDELLRVATEAIKEEIRGAVRRGA